jgi:hypothetical protein
VFILVYLRDQHWFQTAIRRMGVAWIHVLVPCAASRSVNVVLRVFLVQLLVAQPSRAGRSKEL